MGKLTIHVDGKATEVLFVGENISAEQLDGVLRGLTGGMAYCVPNEEEKRNAIIRNAAWDEARRTRLIRSNRLKRLLRWARGGMRSPIVDSDWEIIVQAIECLQAVENGEL